MRYIYCAVLMLLMVWAFPAQAQLCKGSLGDPIKSIDFGAGTARFGPIPTGLNTTYTYLPGTPNDGFYTITNNSAGFNPGWYGITDHTGNAGGYFMLVNASIQPQVFYTQQIDGLCSGTTYEFAAWIMNLLNYPAIRPNIKFEILGLDGTQLGMYSTGDIPESNSPNGWVQYGLQFTMPANQSSVVIKMTNNAPGGIGNDLALDDITFRPCGPTLIASVNNLSDQDLCVEQNTAATLSAIDAGGFSQPEYQWQVNTGSGWTDIPGYTALNEPLKFTIPAKGVTDTYQYRLAAAEAGSFASANCRVLSNVATVRVHAAPVGTATNSGPACEGDAVTLTTSGGVTYTWTGPNGFTSTQQSPKIDNVTTANAGLYQVTVAAYGCQTVVSTTLVVKPKVVADAGKDVAICEGSSTVLQATGGTSYTWSPADGLSNPAIANPVASPDHTTTYTVQVSNGVCMQQASVKVTVLKNPIADAGIGSTIMEGQSVTLNGKVSGDDVTYYWSPAAYLSDAHSLTPVASPSTDITYTLYAVSSHCGTAMSAIEIKVLPKLVIPNTFTPNGDGVNDVWTIAGLNSYPNVHVTVFTRYGIKIYESNGYPVPWDGRYNSKDLPTATYYYIIDFKNTRPTLSGWVFISR